MRTVKTLTCLAIVAVSLAIAVPAGAHTAAVTGSAACSDGSHVVTWTITNDLAKRPMDITATAAMAGVSYATSIANSTVPGGGSTSATTTVPGDLTGDLTISVVATWSDGFTRTFDATVGLTDKCATTTTTAPPTTVTTVPDSVEGVSTSVLPTTTTPTGVDAAQCGPDTLACTGSSNTRPEVLVGFGLLLSGAGLIALKRRRPLTTK